jgi:YD repeat-containing protein
MNGRERAGRMNRPGSSWNALLALTAAGVAAAGLAAPLTARAQDDIGPLPRPVTVYTLGQPVVTVTFNGDFGLVRATGTLEEAPKDPVALTDAGGKKREVSWNELRLLSRVTRATEGIPPGSFTAELTSEASGSTPGVGSGYVAGSTSPVASVTWRTAALPQGQLTLRGDSFGRMAVPLDRLTSLTQEPVQGLVTQFPAGTVRLEVLNGTTISIPFQNARSFRRDVPQNIAVLTLDDGQIFSGKLVELPKVSLVLEPTKDLKPIPLDQVVNLEITAPPGARANSGGV